MGCDARRSGGVGKHFAGKERMRELFNENERENERVVKRGD